MICCNWQAIGRTSKTLECLEQEIIIKLKRSTIFCLLSDNKDDDSRGDHLHDMLASYSRDNNSWGYKQDTVQHTGYAHCVDSRPLALNVKLYV